MGTKPRVSGVPEKLMKDRYIWGLGQQRPPHGSKYKLKLGDEEELGKRSLEGYRPESRLCGGRWESHAHKLPVPRDPWGADGHPQQRHWPTRCHADGQSSSSIVT